MSLRKSITQICLLGIAFFTALILTSCSCCFQASDINPVKETWLCNINLDTNQWTRYADSWFLTGLPNRLEHSGLKSDPEKAETLMTIKVPDFDKVVINGSFQVQIVGNQEHNSVYILGSNISARQTSVEIRGQTLYIQQPTNRLTAFDKTIVRIGVRNLRCLTNLGCGNVYGRGIQSSNLSITSAGSGNIMLMGNINLTQINQTGMGTVTVMGANTPSLDIQVIGNGGVNVCGHVGIHAINHRGDGEINILGADTDCLTIFASGCGTTSIVGFANLKKVTAINRSRVYLYWVNSDGTTVTESDDARVGLAGSTKMLNLNLKNHADFEGQYLRSDNIYVRTQDSAHANVATNQRLFAEARDKSSIYYFDSPKNKSDFTWGDGMIIPLEHIPCPCNVNPPVITKPISWNNSGHYKGEAQIYHHSED